MILDMLARDPAKPECLAMMAREVNGASGITRGRDSDLDSEERTKTYWTIRQRCDTGEHPFGKNETCLGVSQFLIRVFKTGHIEVPCLPFANVLCPPVRGNEAYCWRLC